MRRQILIIVSGIFACAASAFDRDVTASEFDFRSLPVNEEVLKTQGKCHECMHRVLFHIVSATENAILKKCGHTDCEMVKHVCELARSDPAVVKGYLAGQTDAIGKAYAYCYGADSCPHPDVSLKYERNADTMIQRDMCSYIPHELLYTVHDSKNAFEAISKDDESVLKHFKSTISSQIHKPEIVTNVEMFPSFTPMNRRNISPFTPSQNSPFSPFPPGKKYSDDSFTITEKEMDRELVKIITRSNYNDECETCVANVMEKVMLKAIHWVIELCREDQENPAMARKCLMLQKIPNFSLGFLLSKVEPWKFSAGYCIGSRDCLAESNTGYFDLEQGMHGKTKGFFRGVFGNDKYSERYLPEYEERELSRDRDRDMGRERNVRFDDTIHYQEPPRYDEVKQVEKYDKLNRDGRNRFFDRRERNRIGRRFDSVRSAYEFEGDDDLRYIPYRIYRDSEGMDNIRPTYVFPRSKAYPTVETAVQ